MNACELIYQAGANNKMYGVVDGICKITGKKSKGINFESWVRDTFTDIGSLHCGNIISNEALFCFDESSELIMRLAKKDKPQRFRNYSHFVLNGEWHIKDKGQKKDMLNIMLSMPEVCVIGESGQRHLVFKHKVGTWLFEDVTIYPNKDFFIAIHSEVRKLSNDFSNEEISTGNYLQHRILKYGFEDWYKIENEVKKFRGQPMFDLAIFFSKVDYEELY